jgi:hypothetical protein
MKQFLLLILIVITTINNVFSSKLEICSLEKTGDKCSSASKNSYQCGNHYCTNTRYTCDSFMNAGVKIKTYPNKSSKMYRSQIKNYESYIGSIKKCDEKNAHKLVNYINRIFHI